MKGSHGEICTRFGGRREYAELERQGGVKTQSPTGFERLVN